MNRTTLLRLATIASFSGILATTAIAQEATPAAQTTVQQERSAPYNAKRLPMQQEKQSQRWERTKNLLQLQPKQQADWDAYVAAMQPPARVAPAKHPQDMNTLERLDWKAQMRKTQQQNAEQRDQATRKFYTSLSAPQQKAFDSLQHEGRGKMGKHRGMHQPKW